MDNVDGHIVQSEAISPKSVLGSTPATFGRSRPIVIDKSPDRAISHPCEISDESLGKDDNEPSATRPTHEPSATHSESESSADAPARTTGLVALYEGLKSVRELRGGIEDSSWTARAGAVVEAALKAREHYLAASDSEQKTLRARIKADSDRKRGPKESNVDLIALSCAVTAKGKEEQKAWSRLANVVKVAASDGVTAETVGEFLRANNFTRCLERARALQGGTKKRQSTPPILLKSYPPLVDAWKAGKLDALLAKLSSDLEAAGATKAEAAQ